MSFGGGMVKLRETETVYLTTARQVWAYGGLPEDWAALLEVVEVKILVSGVGFCWPV